MAYAANRGLQRIHSSTSQEWDLISDGELENLQERLSVASLESEESDTVIIFGGNGGSRSVSNRSISNSSVISVVSNGSVVSASSTKNSACASSLEKQHERLLSAVSGLAMDPVLQKVAKGSDVPVTTPIEDRLLKQITKLAQDLDDSQEKAKSLTNQNNKLSLENYELKHKAYAVGSLGNKNDTESQNDFVKAGVTLAVGVLLVLQIKRKLFGLNMLGAFVVAGSCGLYGYLADPKGDDTDPKK